MSIEFWTRVVRYSMALMKSKQMYEEMQQEYFSRPVVVSFPGPPEETSWTFTACMLGIIDIKDWVIL